MHSLYPPVHSAEGFYEWAFITALYLLCVITGPLTMMVLYELVFRRPKFKDLTDMRKYFDLPESVNKRVEITTKSGDLPKTDASSPKCWAPIALLGVMFKSGTYHL